MTREEAFRLAMRACEETWNAKICKQIKEALEQEPKWIPVVNKRLPKEDVKVLTTIKWKDGSKYVGIDKIVGGKWMLNIPEDGDTTIAWMPLPKPYELQESERTDEDID